MNIPGSFQLVDVNFNRSTETALLLSQSAGFAVVQYGPNFPGATAAGVTTGLANDATAYTATITVDGVVKNISVVGSAAQTFATLITEINTDLGASATAAVVGNTIVVTSATAGPASTVRIGDVTLFSSVHGTTWGKETITSTPGNNKYLSRGKVDAALLAEIDAILQFTDVGDTPWTNGVDSFTITQNPAAATALTDQALLAAGTYNLNVAIDGGTAVNVPVVVTGTTMTFQQVFNAWKVNLLAAFPGKVDASIVQTNANTITWTVTSSYSSGPTSTVALIDGTAAGLLAAIDAVAAPDFVTTLVAGVAGIVGSAGTGLPTGVIGAIPAQPQARGTLFYATDTKALYWSAGTEWVKIGVYATTPTVEQLLSVVPSSTGSAPLFTIGSGMVFEKEATPAAKGNAVLTYVYWDSTASEWKFFGNNATLGATVNPPEVVV